MHSYIHQLRHNCTYLHAYVGNYVCMTVCTYCMYLHSYTQYVATYYIAT